MISIRPVILAGSEGWRAHPLSSPERPKQFCPLLEVGSPFQDTLERLSDPEFLLPLIITTPALKDIVADQCDEIAFDVEEVLILQDGFQSAAACQAACDWAQTRGETSPLLITPSDHFIADQGAFMRAVVDAAETAEKGYVVSFGVVADRAATQHCYIEVGPRLDAAYSGHHVLQFVEKPDLLKAQSLLKAQRFVWHAGLICATPDVLRVEIDRTDQSIETAVLQKTERLAVVSLLSAWADLDTWPGIWKALSLIET